MLLEYVLLVAVAGVLGGLPVSAIPWIQDKAVVGSGAIIAKSVVSTKFRMWFLAGLEGSGHHYIMGAVDDMFGANSDLPRVGANITLDPFFVAFTMSGDTLHYADAELQGQQEMQGLADEAAGVPFPGTIFYPHKAWSYPRGGGSRKIVRYLDLRKLAEAAESAGVDLRVIYLKRSARELIVADTVHRHFQRQIGVNSPEGAFQEYMKILFTDAAVLHSLLYEIDPGFIVCHDWNDFGDEEQASEIAEFVAPNDDIARKLVTSLVGTGEAHRHEDGEMGIDEMTFDGAQPLVERLQQKLDSFEAHFCGPSRAI